MMRAQRELTIPTMWETNGNQMGTYKKDNKDTMVTIFNFYDLEKLPAPRPKGRKSSDKIRLTESYLYFPEPVCKKLEIEDGTLCDLRINRNKKLIHMLIGSGDFHFTRSGSRDKGSLRINGQDMAFILNNFFETKYFTFYIENDGTITLIPELAKGGNR